MRGVAGVDLTEASISTRRLSCPHSRSSTDFAVPACCVDRASGRAVASANFDSVEAMERNKDQLDRIRATGSQEVTAEVSTSATSSWRSHTCVCPRWPDRTSAPRNRRPHPGNPGLPTSRATWKEDNAIAGRAMYWRPRYCLTLRPSLSCARSRSTSAASRHDDIEAALEDMTVGHGTPSVLCSAAPA